MPPKAGVAKRAVFYERNLFETDVSPATVLTIYLLPDVNLAIRSRLLATLKPGTRIVSHDYDFGEWPPDLQLEMAAPGKTVGDRGEEQGLLLGGPGHRPRASGAGSCSATASPRTTSSALDQNFQKLEGTLAVGGRPAKLENPVLTGEQLSLHRGPWRAPARPLRVFRAHLQQRDRRDGARQPGEKPGAQPQELAWNATRTQIWDPRHVAAGARSRRNRAPDASAVSTALRPIWPAILGAGAALRRASARCARRTSPASPTSRRPTFRPPRSRWTRCCGSPTCGPMTWWSTSDPGTAASSSPRRATTARAASASRSTRRSSRRARRTPGAPASPTAWCFARATCSRPISAPATVVTLYLLPQLVEQLKPRLLALKPGTRIVAHDFGFTGLDAGPDRQHLQELLSLRRAGAGRRASGGWRRSCPAGARELRVRAASRPTSGYAAARAFPAATCRRSRRSSTATASGFVLVENDTSHHFEGRVNGAEMEGRGALGRGRERVTSRWRATRVLAVPDEG